MIRAVLFDMDGTLLDNMELHVDAWVAVAERIGRPTSRNVIGRDWAGKKNEELIPLMLGHDPGVAEVAALAHEKETMYRAQAAKVIVELPGTTALLERLRAKGFKLAVATAAPEGNRALVLDTLGLRKRFDAVVGPEGVARGKPAPDIFLASARALNVEPRECVVFEDAINGVKAALAAEMRAAAVTTTVEEAGLRSAGAEWVMRDFLALPPALEHLLFSNG